MIDHLDTQTNEFLENGTRGDMICAAIEPAMTVGDWNESTELGAVMADLMRRPTIDIDSWGQGTSVDSIFACSPMPEPEVIVRPATVPPKNSPKSDRYGRVQIKPGLFIAHQDVDDFCSKVGGL